MWQNARNLNRSTRQHCRHMCCFSLSLELICLLLSGSQVVKITVQIDIEKVDSDIPEHTETDTIYLTSIIKQLLSHAKHSNIYYTDLCNYPKTLSNWFHNAWIAVTTVDAWWEWCSTRKRCAQYCGSRSIDYCGRFAIYSYIRSGKCSAAPHIINIVVTSSSSPPPPRIRSHCYKMQCVHIHTHRFPYTELPHAKLSRMTYVGKWRSTIVSQNVSQRPHIRVSYFCPDALAAARLLHQFTQHEPKHRMQYT